MRLYLITFRGDLITWKRFPYYWPFARGIRRSSFYFLLNTLRPRQDGRRFPDDIFKSIFLNENVWISIRISLKFVAKGSINNIPPLVEIMAWRRSGDKPLSEPMMVSLLTHICVTRPQWVKEKQIVQLWVIWDIVTIMWRYCSARCVLLQI